METQLQTQLQIQLQTQLLTAVWKNKPAELETLLANPEVVGYLLSLQCKLPGNDAATLLEAAFYKKNYAIIVMLLNFAQQQGWRTTEPGQRWLQAPCAFLPEYLANTLLGFILNDGIKQELLDAIILYTLHKSLLGYAQIMQNKIDHFLEIQESDKTNWVLVFPNLITNMVSLFTFLKNYFESTVERLSSERLADHEVVADVHEHFHVLASRIKIWQIQMQQEYSSICGKLASVMFKPTYENEHQLLKKIIEDGLTIEVKNAADFVEQINRVLEAYLSDKYKESLKYTDFKMQATEVTERGIKYRPFYRLNLFAYSNVIVAIARELDHTLNALHLTVMAEYASKIKKSSLQLEKRYSATIRSLDEERPSLRDRRSQQVIFDVLYDIKYEALELLAEAAAASEVVAQLNKRTAAAVNTAAEAQAAALAPAVAAAESATPPVATEVSASAAGGTATSSTCAAAAVQVSTAGSAAGSSNEATTVQSAELPAAVVATQAVPPPDAIEVSASSARGTVTSSTMATAAAQDSVAKASGAAASENYDVPINNSIKHSTEQQRTLTTEEFKAQLEQRKKDYKEEIDRYKAAQQAAGALSAKNRFLSQIIKTAHQERQVLGAKIAGVKIAEEQLELYLRKHPKLDSKQLMVEVESLLATANSKVKHSSLVQILHNLGGFVKNTADGYQYGLGGFLVHSHRPHGDRNIDPTTVRSIKSMIFDCNIIAILHKIGAVEELKVSASDKDKAKSRPKS